MRIYICILALAATAHAGLLPYLEAPVAAQSSHSSHQVQDTKIIKLIHQTAPSYPHATVPTAPVKILKVIQESGGHSARLSAPVVFPSKIIKVLHQSVAAAPVSAPRIVKVIHQSSPAVVAPRHYVPAPSVQSTKVLKIIKQQPGVPHVIPAEAQNIRVYKVFRQLGGGVSASVAASHASGQVYASSYGHGQAAPTSVVKVVKVLQKPVHYSSQSKW